jgi:hypothetical protein
MQIKFRGGNMGIAPRQVLVDLTSDIPEPIRGADMFKSALDKQKLQEQLKKRELNLGEQSESKP